MLRKILSAFLTVAITAAMLSSCGLMSGGPQKLISAPEATGDMGNVQRALYSKCGNSIMLKYPRNGDNRSAFLMQDLDGDGKKEAVAFYSTMDAEDMNNVHINVIANRNGKWESVDDVTTMGNAIDKVEIADISGNGKVSLMVGVEMFSSTGNQLNIYTFDMKNGIKQHVQENYTDFEICDIMEAGSNQLVLFSLDAADRVSTANLYTFNGETIELKGSAVTDGNISGYAKIQFGTLWGGKSALFIDSNKSAVSMVTDVIYYSDGMLMNPFFDTALAETQLTQRNINAVCKDINGDGVTEIPFSEILPGYANKSDADRVYLTAWKSFDGQLFNDVLRADFYYAGGYRLEYPESWIGNITLVTDNTSRMRSYRIWDPVLQTTGEEVLRIRVYDSDEFSRIDTSGVVELARSDTSVWVARIVDIDGEYAVSESTLKELFSLI